MRFTLNQIIGFSLAVWAAFIGLTVFIEPEYIFSVLNPAVVALGTVLIMVYSSGFVDAFKNRKEGLSLAHLLTFGVTLNWVGMLVRMIRWYVTGKHPSVTFDIEFWFYNLGLWCSVWGGLFLLGAGTLLGKSFKLSTLLGVFFVVFAFLVYMANNEGADIWYNWIRAFSGHGQ